MLDLSEVPGTEQGTCMAGQSCWYSLLLWSKCSGSTSQHQKVGQKRIIKTMHCAPPLLGDSSGPRPLPRLPASESTSITLCSQTCQKAIQKPSLF